MKPISQYNRILIVYSVIQEAESKELDLLNAEFSKSNLNSKVTILLWNGNKKLTSKKEYQRRAQEWIDGDFDFWRKVKNPNILKTLESKYDLLLIFGRDYPEKVRKQLVRISANLKIGFDEKISFLDVILRDTEQNMKAQIEMLKKYLM